MLRKGFAMVFVLASMLVFASALAKTECSVLIDHVELNAQNNFIERAGGLALLDAADNTLRLYNFSADRISCNQSLTIDFAGKNTILGGIALPIVTSGNLTLTAERSADTLALRATEGTALKTYKTVINGGTVIIDSGDNCAIETDGDLVINGGTVQVKGTGGPHDWSTQLARCNGSLILNNGSLTVSAMPGLGLVITQDLVINGGSLTATAQTEEALVAVGHITLNGGSLTVSSQQNEGMMYGEGFTINDGKLVAMGKHRAFGSGNSINITANYRLRTSSNGGFANSGAGWLENFAGPIVKLKP